jgi:hypothetical protein
MSSGTEERFLDMEVHPAAKAFPLMTGKDFEEFKESIRAAGGNKEPIIRNGDVLLDGRNRARAVEQLLREGADVRPQIDEWKPEGGETEAEFIRRANLHRRHLTDDQRAAAVVTLLPLIKKEAAERQRGSRIQQGEKRNPYGRNGKPETAAVNSTPPSPEERKRQRREKDDRSTVGQLAKEAGVSNNKIRGAQAALKHGGEEAVERVRDGKSKVSDEAPKKPRKTKEPPASDDPEFKANVEQRIQRVVDAYAAADRCEVRKVAVRKLQADQEKFGDPGSKGPRPFANDPAASAASGVPVAKSVVSVPEGGHPAVERPELSPVTAQVIGSGGGVA